MPPYPFPVQVKLVVGLCVLHNLIRLSGGASDHWEQVSSQVADEDADDSAHFEVEENSSDSSASLQRDAIAEEMWADYTDCLSRRRANA